MLKNFLHSHNGCFIQGQGQNPARQASMNASIPFEVPATSVNMLCGSGLKAIALGVQALRCNDAEIVIAGGQESMSQVPQRFKFELLSNVCTWFRFLALCWIA